MNRNLNLLLAGRTVSDLGSSIQMLIMPLYILDIGGSAKTIGLFSFLYILPILIIFPFGGVIGDLLNRKKIMVTSDLISGLCVLLLAYISYLGHMNLIVLFVFQVIISAFYGLFDPASKGMLPKLVDKDDLSKANSKVAALRIVAGMIAPLVAVGLYVRFGITLLFLINGLSFILSSISEMFIEYTHENKKTNINLKLVVSDLKVGFSFIKQSKTIFSLCTFFLVIYAFVQPLFSVVLPMFFRTILSYTDTYYGYLQLILFSGAFVGSIIAGYVAGEGKLKKIFITGMILISISIGLYAVMLQPTTVMFLGNDTLIFFILFSFSLFLLYTSFMLVGIPMQTYVQQETPEQYMSRVFSIVSLITKGGAPLGALIYGFVVERIDIHISAIFIAVIVFLLVLYYVSVFKNISEVEA